MAISVLDVRDTAQVPRVSVPSLRLVPAAVAAPTAVRRLPLTVLTAGMLGVVEAVGLLAVALTGLDGVLSSVVSLSGWMAAAGLVVLAGWIVLAAGGGAALIDGAGRRLVLTVAWAELGLLAVLGVVATTTTAVVPVPAALPLPLLLLVTAAVPVGKLLLVGSPSAVSWIAQGPRLRERRIDPVAAHRVLATLTLGVIGLSLTAVAVLVPAQGGAADVPASAVFSQH